MDRGQGRELHNAIGMAGRSRGRQGEGSVDMIISRDNPECMPVPMQEEPYQRFTLMWTNLSLHYILR